MQVRNNFVETFACSVQSERFAPETNTTDETYPCVTHFRLSPWLCPSTAGCSPPSMPSNVFRLLLSCFAFHLGFVHPLQGVALHQCLPSIAFLFRLSPRLCPFTAGCNPPSMPSIVLRLLLSCFAFHLGFVHSL